jgi:hypothetical protein
VIDCDTVHANEAVSCTMALGEAPVAAFHMNYSLTFPAQVAIGTAATAAATAYLNAKFHFYQDLRGLLIAKANERKVVKAGKSDGNLGM